MYVSSKEYEMVVMAVYSQHILDVHNEEMASHPATAGGGKKTDLQQHLQVTSLLCFFCFVVQFVILFSNVFDFSSCLLSCHKIMF